ncbi:hypothetical protein Q8F55_009215 [Vanrija albida]|uniref:Enoyl-CoA hydratase n=1 Tax=Vanrija albida TaxID=181172 RepID=A0ABR3PT10_9TREE
MSASELTTQPPDITGAHLVLSFPAPHVLHVALDRPAKWNALLAKDNWALDSIWAWYEGEPSLRCAILGTTSRRAFCAGGDLIELGQKDRRAWPESGLAGLAKRPMRKPVIAAVNGVVIGGAVEMLTNLDVVVAGEGAVLSLPEAKRGLLMTGRDVPAREALQIGLVNDVVPDDAVEARALEIAVQTAANSPDAVMLALYGLRLAERHAGYQGMMDEYFSSRELQVLLRGENTKEGLRAFIEKRPPRWVNSKL